MIKNKQLTSIVSILFTAILLWILFANIELESLTKSLYKVKWDMAFFAFLCHASTYVFRVLIFKSFMGHKVTFAKLLQVHMLHNFYVHIIPANLGELSFPMLLSKEVPKKDSLAVLTISRIIVLSITLLLFTFSVFLVFDTSIRNLIKFDLQNWILGILIIVLILCMLVILRKRLNKLRIFHKLSGILYDFFSKLNAEKLKMKNSLFLIKIMVLSTLSIVGLICYYHIILKQCGIQLTIFEIIFVSSIGLAFLVLPIKSVGGFGTTEGSWAVGLIALGIAKQPAIESGFVIHIFALINVFVLFLVGLTYKFLVKK